MKLLVMAAKQAKTKNETVPIRQVAYQQSTYLSYPSLSLTNNAMPMLIDNSRDNLPPTIFNEESASVYKGGKNKQKEIKAIPVV